MGALGQGIEPTLKEVKHSLRSIKFPGEI